METWQGLNRVLVFHKTYERLFQSALALSVGPLLSRRAFVLKLGSRRSSKIIRRSMIPHRLRYRSDMTATQTRSADTAHLELPSFDVCRPSSSKSCSAHYYSPSMHHQRYIRAAPRAGVTLLPLTTASVDDTQTAVVIEMRNTPRPAGDAVAEAAATAAVATRSPTPSTAGPGGTGAGAAAGDVDTVGVTIAIMEAEARASGVLGLNVWQASSRTSATESTL